MYTKSAENKVAKKSLGSHQLPRLHFYNNKKKSLAPCQILSLGKHVKCMHISHDMVFFNFQKEKKMKIARPHHFSFFSDEYQDIHFSWPKLTDLQIYATATLTTE